MISVIGIVSIPFIFLSLVFVYYHAKFIKLYNECNNRKNALHELMVHKFELLLYFSLDTESDQLIDVQDLTLLQGVSYLEEKCGNFNLSDEDRAELNDINLEIENAQNMYNHSKEIFDRFTSTFPGKHFSTFLVDKS